MTDEQIKLRAMQILDEKINKLFIDNPMAMMNPNWSQRLFKGSDQLSYHDWSDAPILKYIDNFKAKFTRDMTDVDAGLFKVRSLQGNESSFVIEQVMRWFGMQSDNKRLHTRSIKVNNLKAGQEIEFYYETPYVAMYTEDGSRYEYNGELVKRSGGFIHLRGTNGRVRKVKDLGGSLDGGLSEKMMWGKIDRISEGIAYFKDVNKKGTTHETAVPVSKMYGKDIRYNRVEGEVQRYARKGMIEWFENELRERGITKENNKFKYYMMKFIPTATRFTNKALVFSILGGIMSLHAGLANLVGGTFVQFMTNPVKYLKYRRRGMQLIKQATNYQWDRIPEKEKQTYEMQFMWNLHRTLKGSGLTGEGVTDLVAENGNMGLNSKLFKLTMDENTRAIIRVMLDKYGWNDYNNKVTALKEERYTAEPVRQAEITRELAKLNEDWKNHKAELALKPSTMTDKVLRKLTGAIENAGYSINEDLKVDKKSAMQIVKDMIQFKIEKGWFKFFLMPEHWLRTTSIAVGLQEGLSMGLEGTELLKYAESMERNTQAKYDNFEKQLLNASELGSFFGRFGHFKYNRIKVMKRMIPEAITQTSVEGLTSMIDPTKSMIKSVESDGTVKYTPNVAQKMLNTIMANSVANAVKKSMWGAGIIGSPFIDTIYSAMNIMTTALTDGWDDDDERYSLYFDILEATPYGLGKSQVLQWGFMPDDTAFYDYNRSSSAMADLVEAFDKSLEDGIGAIYTELAVPFRAKPSWAIAAEKKEKKKW